MLVCNFAAMKPFSSKQYFYLSLLLACRIIESNSTPSELKDCLCQYCSAGLSRLARGGKTFCILIKAVRKKMWLWKFFTGASSVPPNRQAPLLQQNSEDLFIFKVRSFSCAGGDCWGRLRGQNADVSWLLQLVPPVHRLRPQTPHPCGFLFILSSCGLISPWRPHQGYDRSQLVAVIELCLFEPSENMCKAFKHFPPPPPKIECLFPDLPFSFQLTDLIVIHLSAIVSVLSKGTENRYDKCLNMRFNLASVVL